MFYYCIFRILNIDILDTQRNQQCLIGIGIIKHGARRKLKIENQHLAEYFDSNFELGELIPAEIQQTFIFGNAISNNYSFFFAKSPDHSKIIAVDS